MKMKNNPLKIIKISTNGIIFWLFLLSSILMNSCATKDIVRVWNSNEEYNRNIKKILALGLINQVSLRHNAEFAFVDASKKAGIWAIDGMSVFPPQMGKPFEDLERDRAHLLDKGFDAILTISIIDVSAERYVKPETKYVPLVYYDRFSNYYYRTEALVYKPGYFSLESRYFLETNLYEVKTGKLVWSGRSYIFDPQDVERFVPKYANKLFNELLPAGVIDG
jgi:hypothetical protein